MGLPIRRVDHHTGLPSPSTTDVVGDAAVVVAGVAVTFGSRLLRGLC